MIIIGDYKLLFAVQGYLSSFEVLYDELLKERLELDAKSKKATEKYPNNTEISQWRPRFDGFFGISSSVDEGDGDM